MERTNENLSKNSIDSNFKEFYDSLCIKPIEKPENIDEETKNEATLHILTPFSNAKKEIEPLKETLSEDSKTDSKTAQNLEEIAINKHNLGVKYLFGKDGYARDCYKSLSLFKEAAKLNLPQAQYNLGNQYLTGTGCKKSTQKGIKWITLAAANGNKKAEQLLKALALFPDPEMIQNLHEGWYKEKDLCHLL